MNPGAQAAGAQGLRVEAVELRRVRLPLVSPFRTSFGTQTEREALLVRLRCSDTEGWGECVALADPVYSSEYVAGAEAVLRDHLIPRLLACPPLSAAAVAAVLRPVLGHRMAKAALEMAVLDAELRRAAMSLGAYLGATGTAVDCGVSVGIMPDIPTLLAAVDAYLQAGYRRIKLKVEPGWDLAPVRAVRRHVGDGVPLQVDANAAYTIADAEHLCRLDEFHLLLVEQPLPEEDIRGHAALAARMRTPVCLDESITSARAAADAVLAGACSIVNIKAGRVGGYLEARRVHDVCISLGVPVWCGGMLETGLGRAANVALAALPGFTLPGDTSASDRYYHRDITPPFVLEDGRLRVPDGPGLGVDVLPDVLEEVTVSTALVRR